MLATPTEVRVRPSVAAPEPASPTVNRETLPPPRRRFSISTALLLLLLFAVFQQLSWLPTASGGGGGVSSELLIPDGGPAQAEKLRWQAALASLSSSRRRYVIIDAKNGLGNRLRAVASAMAVARAIGRCARARRLAACRLRFVS